MEASKVYAVLASILGLIGSLMNARASSHIIKPSVKGGGSLDLTSAAAKSARAWSVWGWSCVFGAFLCGTMAVLVQ